MLYHTEYHGVEDNAVDVSNCLKSYYKEIVILSETFGTNSLINNDHLWLKTE